MYQLAHAPLFGGGPVSPVSLLLLPDALDPCTCAVHIVHTQAILQIYRQQPIAGATERVTGAGVGGAPGGAPVSHQVARSDTFFLIVKVKK